MNERPILFCAPMVRAILSGCKCTTRRVIRPQPKRVHAWNGRYLLTERFSERNEDQACPYGVVGDRLWVRETWSEGEQYDTSPVYRADGEGPWKWHPSIFMPRWASRIDLEITGVSVDRVQNIDPLDIEREGLNCGTWEQFGALWDRINGQRTEEAFAENPWVWIIDFRPVAKLSVATSSGSAGDRLREEAAG